MRAIGEFKEEENANTFSAFLHNEGINNETEKDDDVWTVWVQDEECLERAVRELERFHENPHRPEYLKVARQAETQSRAEEKNSSRSRYKQIDLGRKWRPRGRAGGVTMGLVLVSAAVFLITGMGGNPTNNWLQRFSITEYDVIGNTIRWMPGLPEISSWEVWRLFSPVFIHFGAIHFLFNMVWLYDLGGMLESRKGAWFLALFFLLSGISSNFGQYLSAGPSFGGMSGVVYALFGYAWMKGRFDPGDGIGVPSSTVLIMMGWFVLCVMSIIPNVANAAHAIGLVVGAAWGYLSAVRWRR